MTLFDYSSAMLLETQLFGSALEPDAESASPRHDIRISARTAGLLIPICLVSTWLVYRLDHAQDDLQSELLCWLVLLALHYIRPMHIQTGELRFADGRFLVAAGIMIVSCLRKQTNASAILFPIVLLVVHIARASCHPGQARTDFLTAHAVTTIFSAAILYMASSTTLRANEWIALIPLLLAFGAIFVTLDLARNMLKDAMTTAQDVVSPRKLVLTVLIFLGWALAFRWSQQSGPSSAIPLATCCVALLKTINWSIMFALASWDLAPAISTFAAAMSTSPSHSLLLNSGKVGVCVLALIQIRHSVKVNYGKAETVLLMGTALVVILLSFGGPHISTSWQNASFRAPLASSDTPHPIETLVSRAATNFQSMLARQSQTLGSAEREYRRRYKMEPPPGFDRWFAYALKHNSLIIDDFDIIYQSLAPLLSFSPSILRQNMLDAIADRGDIYACGFRSGNYSCQGDGRGWQFGQFLSDLESEMPDVFMLFHDYDEPRVMLTGSHDTRQPVSFTDMDGQPLYDMVAAHCASEFATPLSAPRRHIETYGLPFMQDHNRDLSVCAHDEYTKLHGYLMSPATASFTGQPLPVLSPARLSTFSDFVLPPLEYINWTDEKGDVPELSWHEKSDELYWAGSTTGGVAKAHDPSWHNFHRHRFVAISNRLSDRNATFLGGNRYGSWTPYESWPHDSRFDVAFTNVVQCEKGEEAKEEEEEEKEGDGDACEAMKSYYRVKDDDGSPPSEQFLHKYLMDLDGNSFSGRFYSHLRSGSVSLKMALFQEWHGDRLVPWLHYVPVSLAMDEVPELMRFLATTNAGNEISRRVAERGRDGARKLLRKEDMTIYAYRLVLELARLLDENRVVDEGV